MISILVKGCSFDGTYKYNLDGRGQIIGGNMAGTNSEELIREIGQWRKLRSTLDRAVAHLILSSAPEDPRMDDSTWAAIGERFAIEMGFENCARVVVRHDDAEQEHIHIVCSRMDSKGKTVHDANDRYRAERSLAGIEADFGLRRVNKLKSPISKKKAPAKGRKSVKKPAPPKTTTKEVLMNTHQPEIASADASMPEPLNTGTDLAQHAYSLAQGATVMTAWVGDDPNERQRRNIKRVIRDPNYDEMVKRLLDPDVTKIFHHQRGSVIYLNQPERIADDGDRLTAYKMSHERAARAMVALACSRGWTSIVFNGPHDFIVAAMTEAVAQGIPVHPRDAAQRQILDQIMGVSGGAMGTVAIAMAFQPTEPPFPHEPIPDLEPAQPAPAAPVVPPVQLNTNLAAKLGLRRQQSTPEDHSNHSGPKGP